jgi:hypothetical protein
MFDGCHLESAFEDRALTLCAIVKDEDTLSHPTLSRMSYAEQTQILLQNAHHQGCCETRRRLI